MRGDVQLALGVTLGICLWTPVVRAQSAASAPPAPAAASADPLGRDTPKGTVLEFMSAVQKGNTEAAALYLNTPLRGAQAAQLAQQLYVVLDSRLPARLNELSDRPEGSRRNPLKPDLDVIGTITTGTGTLDLTVERVSRAKTSPVWLFSAQTLESVPEVYDEINLVSIDRYLPAFLTKHRLAGIRLFEWLILCLAIPLSYALMGLLSRVFKPLMVVWHRRYGAADMPVPDRLPGFVRLLILAAGIRWLLGSLDLPLAERKFWSAAVAMLLITAAAWILLRFNALAERSVKRRARTSSVAEVSSLLRLGRRVVDVLVVSAGVVTTMHYFGFDPTAALAGLGIGGIAVALAAQKTLENVVGGVSIVFDGAVRVGDFLKLGDTFGTVDYIGLRSTRIRTLDRTILSVPNGQMANVNVETLSSRDKYWFHHSLGLPYDTSSAQTRAIVGGIRNHLASHPAIDRIEPIRVRFLRFGPFSLDIEVFAYITAADWEAFLETQEELLLEVMAIVERAGAAIALPSQMLHVADARASAPGPRRIGAARSARLAARQPAGSV
jgi:MscS family membrane protein